VKAKRLQDLVPKGADAVYSRTSRRGFLAKTSALLAAIGLGEVGVARAAEAAPLCCTGIACVDMGLECVCGDPFPIECPTGWTYTGYTWACCLGGHQEKLFMCRDCQKGRHICVCGCNSNFNCQSSLTELSAQGIKLGRPV
jgi:hypothetical protein